MHGLYPNDASLLDSIGRKLLELLVARINRDSGTVARINLCRIQFKISSIGRAVRQNLEEMLQPIIRLVLFPILDSARKEIFSFWVN